MIIVAIKNGWLMVKISKEASAKNTANLLRATGQTIRQNGIAAATVADMAAKVGLTHGAVYRHFPSKDALTAAAIRADFAVVTDGLAALRARDATLEQYFLGYLDPDHRDYFMRGCPVAPLAAEISRTGDEPKAAFCEGVAANVQAIADLTHMEDPELAQDYAIFSLAALSGAMAMARATKAVDPAFSDRVLAATLAGLLGARHMASE
jgi:TetR/AcrR family transcriptional regulator, transcriptional repressor for nem operon